MTVYLILSLCIILLVVVLCAFRCVRQRRKELLLTRRAKKAPMPMPNRKDFDRLDKEQGDNQDGGGAAAKSGNILAAVFELSAKKKAAAAQNNPYAQPQNLTPSEQKKTGNTISRVDFFDPADGTNPDEPKDGRIYNRERVLLPNTPSPTPKLDKLNFRNVMQPSRQ